MHSIQPKVELYWNDDPIKHIEHCGRVCYNSYDKITEDSADKFVEGLIKAGHLSVLEHAAATNKVLDLKGPPDSMAEDDPEFGLLASRASQDSIRFSDLVKLWSCLRTAEALRDVPRSEDMLTFDITASRSFTHQLVRHRNLSFSEQSLRYVKLNKEDFKYISPFKTPIEGILLEELLDQALDTYTKLLKEGASADEARAVLPQCTATRIFVTGSLYWWAHFLALRLSKRASKEMVKVAHQIYTLSPEKLRKHLIVNMGLEQQFEEAIAYAE